MPEIGARMFFKHFRKKKQQKRRIYTQMVVFGTVYNLPRLTMINQSPPAVLESRLLFVYTALLTATDVTEGEQVLEAIEQMSNETVGVELISLDGSNEGIIGSELKAALEQYNSDEPFREMLKNKAGVVGDSVTLNDYLRWVLENNQDSAT